MSDFFPNSPARSCALCSYSLVMHASRFKSRSRFRRTTRIRGNRTPREIVKARRPRSTGEKEEPRRALVKMHMIPASLRSAADFYGFHSSRLPFLFPRVMMALSRARKKSSRLLYLRATISGSLRERNTHLCPYVAQPLHAFAVTPSPRLVPPVFPPRVSPSAYVSSRVRHASAT